jgi:CRP/FNR family transcriptional regulator
MKSSSQRPGLTPGCAGCAIRLLCLPAGLDPAALNDGTLRKTRIPRGTCLYRAGDALRAIYAIRAGFLKSRVLLADGREQVTGFHMRGEAVGLDGVGAGTHICDAVALEDSEVCEMPFSTVDQLCGSMPSLNQQVRQIIGQEITGSRAVQIMLSGSRADERVAAFLLDLSQRYAERGYSAREFELRMKREEIGSYLGMQIETVSRVFSQLQQQRVVDIRRRRVRIIEQARLRELAHRLPRASAAVAAPAGACELHPF